MARRGPTVGCQTMNLLRLEKVGHSFLGRTVLDGIHMEIAAGEMVALLGPSGSGKSTLAHIAAGLVEPRQGRVLRNYRRHAVIFQEPRLLPWKNAADNILLGIRSRGLDRKAVRAKLEAAVARVSLEAADMDKFPCQLSGGMRQRVAIARALIADPEFIYFDEPFSALDVALKRRMQDLVIANTGSVAFGGLFITHDLSEAVRVAHRILVLRRDGHGIAGAREVPLEARERDDRFVFETATAFLQSDGIFAHINECDERSLP